MGKILTFMWEIRGKKVLITGSAIRIGRAISLAFARKGANLLLHYNTSESHAMTLKSEAERLGVQVFTIKMDLSEPSAGEKLFDLILSQTGPVDILINNASVYPRDNSSNLSYPNLLKSINLHAWTPFQLGRCMYNTGNRGVIINLLDTRVWGYDKAHLSYFLGKSLLATLTKVMALEFAPLLRVNAIAPGLILPPPGEDYAYLEKLSHSNPLHKYGSEEDVVEAVMFLTHSDFITGQVIFVDGGRFLLGPYTNATI